MEDAVHPDNVVALPDVFRGAFSICNADPDIYEFIERECLHFVLTYAVSRQGKSFWFRQLLNRYLQRGEVDVIMVKGTTEEEDGPYVRLSLANRMIYTRPDKQIFTFIKQEVARRDKLLYQALTRGQKPPEMRRLAIFWDDIQGNDQSDVASERELNSILNSMAKQGRHYNIVNYVGVQSYKSIHKNVRSQASMFLTFFPVDREYRKAIYEEFFQVGRFRDFSSIVLPRFTIMGMVKAEDNMFLAFRGGRKPRTITTSGEEIPHEPIKPVAKGRAKSRKPQSRKR